MPSTGETFRDLKVWQKAHQLALLAYATTKQFPSHEQYALVQQTRRAATSVAANIVEGWKRRSDKDNAHFLNIADASLEETKYFTLLARDLGYIDHSQYEKCRTLCGEIGLMLNALSKTLKFSH